MSPSGPTLIPVVCAPVGSGTVATVSKVPVCGSIFWIAPDTLEAYRFPLGSEVIDSGSCPRAGLKLTTTVGCSGLPGGAASAFAPTLSTADKPAAIEATLCAPPTFVIVIPPAIQSSFNHFVSDHFVAASFAPAATSNTLLARRIFASNGTVPPRRPQRRPRRFRDFLRRTAAPAEGVTETWQRKFDVSRRRPLLMCPLRNQARGGVTCPEILVFGLWMAGRRYGRPLRSFRRSCLPRATERTRRATKR